MSPTRVFLVGEGPSDVGDLAAFLSYRAGREGFLQPILRKLSGGCELEFLGQKLSALGKTKVKTPAKHLSRKAAQAYALAVGDCEAVVFASDADRTPGSRATEIEATKRIETLLKSIERGFHDARQTTRRDIVAVAALPCRMIEAWALGDARALAQVSGKPVSACGVSSPELLWGDETDPSSQHPKRVLQRIVGASPDFAAIADAADPKTLWNTCPLSFAPFAEKIREATARCAKR